MPHYFVSYSSRELHVEILLDALNLVLGRIFKQRRTPSALKIATSQYDRAGAIGFVSLPPPPATLESGTTEYDQILEEVKGASFCVVILDGLQPNVVFEYGIMVGMRKPLLLFREELAEIDISGFFQGVSSEVAGTPMVLDTQFSDVKGQDCAVWFKFDPKRTRHVVLEEYTKRADRITGFVEIKKVGPLFD